MREITLEELLEAGCHFGHQVSRQNPKARDFVFEARDNIHIIDLAKTKEGLDGAAAFVYDLGKRGGSLLVVGTKRQAQAMVQEQVKRALEETNAKDRPEGEEGIFYVTNRWMGGTLTNFSEIAKNYKKLKDLSDKLRDDEVKSLYTKREIGQWAKDVEKLKGFYGGVATIKRLPDALFIIDTHLEDLAVRESQTTGIDTVGIVDTNADPLAVNYAIPANDDALGSLKLIITHIIDSWIEGRVKGAEVESKETVLEETKGTKETKETKETKGTKETKETKGTKGTEGKKATKATKTAKTKKAKKVDSESSSE